MDPRDPRDESNDHSARQEAPAPPAERLATLDRRLAEAEAHHTSLEAQRQELAEMNARQEERLAAQAARPTAPVDPRAWMTTVAEVQRWANGATHPSWIHAAYADLRQHLTKMDARLDEMEASLSLLHAKMETLIMRLAMDEEEETDA